MNFDESIFIAHKIQDLHDRFKALLKENEELKEKLAQASKCDICENVEIMYLC